MIQSQSGTSSLLSPFLAAPNPRRRLARLPRSQRRVFVVIVIQRLGQVIRIPHLGIRVRILKSFRLRLMTAFIAHDAVVCAHRDSAGSPLGPAAAAAVVVVVAVLAGTALLVLDVADGAAKDALQEPRAAHVVGIHHAAAAELDALAGVVHPGKVNVQRRLDDAKDDGDGAGLAAGYVKLAHQPVEAVQRAVRTQRNQVEGVDDGGDGCLAEEEELGQDADGFENLGKDPEPLNDIELAFHYVSELYVG